MLDKTDLENNKRKSGLIRHAADRRVVLNVFITILILFLQWISIISHPVFFFLSVVLVYQCYVINHNHQHVAVFYQSVLNRVFSALLSVTTGMPGNNLKPLHNDNHHHFLNREGDWMSTLKVPAYNGLVRLLVYPYYAAQNYAPRKSAVMAAYKKRDPEFATGLKIDRLALGIVFVTAFIVNPVNTMIYLVLPWALAQYWVINANYLQHNGCDNKSRFRHSRNVTGKVFNYLMYNGGFHTIHHLRPSAHWSDLSYLHRQHVSDKTRDLDSNSFFGMFINTISSKKHEPAV